MATKIGSLFGDVSLRTSQLDKDIAGVGKKLKKMGKNMQSLGKSMTMGLTAPLAAFGALSVKAFAEQEKAESTLRASLQASGQEVDANMQKLKRMASEIQKVTTVGDEMSLAMMQQAVSMGVQADQLDEATRGAIGLSKAFNLDLKMAMRASSAALLGQTEMLTRYIPELKDIEDPAERVALVHLKMGEGFTVATAEANATGGQLIQLKNAFGDLQEQVGEILAEYLTPLIDKLRALVTKLQEADPALMKLGVQIAAVVAVAGPLLLILGKLAVVLSSVWAWIIAAGVGLGLLLDKMGFLKEIGEALGQLFIDIFINSSLTAALGSFLGMLGEVIETFTGIQFSAKKVRADVIKVFAAIGRAIDAVLGKLGRMWELFGKYSGATGAGEGLGNLISSIAFRAAGGPVSSGSPYIVGEQGPELFVPKYSGSIVPNHALGGEGGGQTINMTFNGVGMEIQSFIKNNRSALGEIAVQAVQENNLRTV